MRGFLQISQNKLRKRTFCARLPRNFIKQASKTGVSCEASSKFLRPSFQNERFVRGFLQISKNKLPNQRFVRGFLEISQNKLPKRTFRATLPRISIENLRFATVSCNGPAESYERVHPAKAKCASRYNGVQNFKMYVLLQRRAQKCMNPAHDVRGNPRHTKITISPQFRTSDQHEVTRGFTDEVTNLHFTTVLDVR